MATTKTIRHTVYTGTAAQWAASSVVLLKGEIGFETDTGLFKFGDGVNTFAALKYANDIPTTVAELADSGNYATKEYVAEVLAAATGGESASDVLASLNAHIADTANPHGVTKAQVGLGNVDNTSDADKPISTAQQTALDAKQDKLTFDTTPTTGSTNPVTSSGIKAAIEAAAPDLTDYLTKAGAAGTLSVSMNETTYVITFTLTAADGTTVLSTASVDLPLESVVVSGSYDTTTKSVVLTLKDGSTVTFSVADLVSGLVQTSDLAAIATSGNLSDATEDATHRTVTDTEKATWNAKQDALTIDTALSTTSTNPVQNAAIAAGVNEAKTAASTAQSAADAAQSTADANATAISALQSSAVKESTDLSDSGDLIRYTDEIVIVGGEL